MGARIVGTGSYVPENIVDNNYLSTIVDTNDEWIRSRTGIKERRITTREGTTEMAIKAATAALENARMKPEKIDLIIVATMTPDTCIPNTACEVQNAMKALNATCFDINVACTGFVFGLNTVYAYMEAGLAETALLIGADTMSKVLDWNDRSTCVLFGDGAGAVVLKQSKRHGVIAVETGSDGEKKDALTCKGRQIENPFIKADIQKEYITMEGQEVFKFAVTKVPECICKLLRESNTKIEDIKYMVLHQANRRIVGSVAKRLKMELDKFPMNLDKYGNTSGASIPILLDELHQKKKLRRGDKIVISGFGGGLTWGATLLEW